MIIRRYLLRVCAPSTRRWGCRATRTQPFLTPENEDGGKAKRWEIRLTSGNVLVFGGTGIRCRCQIEKKTPHIIFREETWKLIISCSHESWLGRARRERGCVCTSSPCLRTLRVDLGPLPQATYSWGVSSFAKSAIWDKKKKGGKNTSHFFITQKNR